VVLLGLEGRPSVRFRTVRGDWLNNIEVTHAVQRFALAQFTLHQHRDGALLLRIARPDHAPDALRNVLLELFGSGQRLTIETLDAFEGKVVQYTSDLAEAQP
jgi:phenylacetate-CoA ligase